MKWLNQHDPHLALSFLLLKENMKLHETFKHINLKWELSLRFFKHVCLNHRWVNFLFWMSCFSDSFDEAKEDLLASWIAYLTQ